MLVGLTGYQALKAQAALKQVAADFDRLSGQMTSGDQAGARATIAAAQRHSRQANDNLDGPGWWLAGRVPGLGPNVRAVQDVARGKSRSVRGRAA